MFFISFDSILNLKITSQKLAGQLLEFVQVVVLIFVEAENGKDIHGVLVKHHSFLVILLFGPCKLIHGHLFQEDH